jgi:hypothetical protein
MKTLTNNRGRLTPEQMAAFEAALTVGLRRETDFVLRMKDRPVTEKLLTANYHDTKRLLMDIRRSTANETKQ